MVQLHLEVITRSAKSPQHKTPILFIHGAWCGASVWNEHFLPYFAELGYETHAFSFRAHGQSEGREKLKFVRIQDYVEDLVSVVAGLSSPPILIGHSLGGFVLMHYLARYPVETAILLSPVPSHGAFEMTKKLAIQEPLSFLLSNLTFSLWPAISTLKKARNLLFSEDLPEELLARYHGQLQDESALAFFDELFLDLPRKSPHTGRRLVIRGDRDKLISRDGCLATSSFLGAEFLDVEGVAHMLMLDVNWPAAAKAIANYLKKS